MPTNLLLCGKPFRQVVIAANSIGIPSTNLVHPSQGVKHSREMDASTVAAGATVKQSDGDDAQSLAFYLERGYSTFSSERLATSLSIKKISDTTR